MKKYHKLIIGIDQSYSNTGVTVIGIHQGTKKAEILDIKSIHLEHVKIHSEKRKRIYQVLDHLLLKCSFKAEIIECICERTRVHGGGNSFINIDAIKAMGSLTALIVDVCYKHNVPVYSVDTRCWKSQIIGSCKKVDNPYGVPPEKWLTVKWVIDRGFEHKVLEPVPGKRTKGTFIRNGEKYTYNNDAADSAGIAMFLVHGDPTKLQPEH